MLLGEGVVAGVWHQRRAGRRLPITVEPLCRLTTTDRRQLDEQLARVGQLLDATPDLTIGKVTVGPHA
ncbi:hypothetical protein [Streptomyces zagrosensis]|uniref:Winged helix DNA-binding domain-containing protein n=1 Tax=Streptomyces zagrosensis TaxID=1042984 RepID=A0A7W9QCK1_9ACTN|nr:hypothetical protein [Streptomyces zagrosensis]MBB5937781.1 hypothetical protein [Streptomyces zagrosensis]